MSLTSGERLGQYEILAPIGAGGMGEVYRARDVKLGRDVAIKVLPDAFSGDEEKLARFAREAHLLASVNHANVATLYGLEESDGQRFLVMELVEGETLAEQIASGPLRIEEALPLLRQIAEGLEAAHEKGIIHRDLKPANVKITPEGTPKILDFGLAKAALQEEVSPESPTITRQGTQTGVLLGTAAYMSPEQARGKALDKKTDIWSFGCIFYEALTGRSAFLGETVSDTIARILEREPDWDRLPAAPVFVRRLLRRCLRKDPAHRLHDIADVRIEIEESASQPEIAEGTTVGAKRSRAWLTVGLVGLGAAAMASVTVWNLARPPMAGDISRFVIRVPAQTSVAGYYFPIAVSPDGRRLVYVAETMESPNGRQLYLQPFDELEPEPIPGSEGARAPFFSPDGESVGFFAGGKLKRVSLAGGNPLTLCEILGPGQATWGPDDTIFITPSQGPTVLKVSAGGGAPEPVVGAPAPPGAQRYLSPVVLPGGESLLLTVSYGGGFENHHLVVLSPGTGELRTLIEGGAFARYVSSGHLLYARGDSLLAVPFDAKAHKVLGPPVPVLQRGDTGDVDGPQKFDVSTTGSLVYVAGQALSRSNSLFWLARHGDRQPVELKPRTYTVPSLSPDGQRVAMTTTGNVMETWILEIEQGALTRFTFEGSNHFGVWSPDGRFLAFSSDRKGPHNLYRKPSDGSGRAEQLTVSDYHEDPGSWSPDGNVLAFARNHHETNWDLWLLHLEGERRPEPFLRTGFDEIRPMISPDGRWLAYVSNESGRREVYVRPFPHGGAKWPISIDGGDQPRWAPDGRELFYFKGDNLMAVPIAAGPTFEAGRPRLLLQTRIPFWGFGAPNYDVTTDGQRFLMIAPDPQPPPTEIYVTLNWFQELERLVPREN